MTQDLESGSNKGEPVASRSTGGPQLVADNEGLVAVNIGKSFKKRPVLRGVSLGLHRGEAVRHDRFRIEE